MRDPDNPDSSQRITMTSFLPQHEGWLPYWLLLVSILSVGNTIQAYLTTKNTREVYMRAGQEITALTSRIFGTWTLVSAVVRLYAAYNISNPQVYELALVVFTVAWVHFVTEWVVFGRAAWGRGLAGPILISTGSLFWMFSQWAFYVG